MTLSILRSGWAIAATIAGAAALLPTQLAAQQLTLLHVNDTHSHLAAWGPKDASLDGTVGGLPKVATIVAAQRAVDPQLLLVHAGDFMDGDLFFNEYRGVPELKLLQSIGLDAIALGNHEFAYGPAFLASVLNTAWPGGVGGVPVLGTNLGSCPQVAPWNPGTLMKMVNGVKVGLFGLTLPGLPLARPAPCTIDSLTTSAQSAVTALRANGAQVIIALSHAGMVQARALASSVSGIDVIVNGHDNALLGQPETVARSGGGVTRIVSAGSQYEWVGRLQLGVSSGDVSLVSYALIRVGEDVVPDAGMQSAIADLKVPIVARYGDVYRHALAWSKDTIAAERDARHAKRDTPLGNLLTDAYRGRTGTDIAIEAMGYLGDAVPAGYVVGADVFRSMSMGPIRNAAGQWIPQPWRLVTFRATGAALIAALETTIGLGGNYFPQVSGVRLDFDSRLPVGGRILLDKVHVGGHKLVATHLYSVTVTEGVYSALVSLKVPMQDVAPLSELAFDAGRYWLAAQGVIEAESSNRIRDVAAIGK